MPPRLSTISNAIVKSRAATLPDDLIAVTFSIDLHGRADHTGLLIGVDGVYHLLHFLPGKLELKEFIPKQFHAPLKVISAEESESFLAHCRRVSKNAKVEYGYIFDGSYYDEEGNYFSETGLPEYSTCVGFCVNVISGYLLDKKKYLENEDWTAEDPNSTYFKDFLKEAQKNDPEIDEDSFKSHHKRVFPSELVASTFYGTEKLSIRKSVIEDILSNVEIVISQRRSQFPLSVPVAVEAAVAEKTEDEEE